MDHNHVNLDTTAHYRHLGSTPTPALVEPTPVIAPSMRPLNVPSVMPDITVQVCKCSVRVYGDCEVIRLMRNASLG